MFGAVDCHPHGLLTGLVHPVQALTPALNLVFLDQGPREDLCSQVPAPGAAGLSVLWLVSVTARLHAWHEDFGNL